MPRCPLPWVRACRCGFIAYRGSAPYRKLSIDGSPHTGIDSAASHHYANPRQSGAPRLKRPDITSPSWPALNRTDTHGYRRSAPAWTREVAIQPGGFEPLCDSVLPPACSRCSRPLDDVVGGSDSVGNGLDGDVFWLVSEHGSRSPSARPGRLSSPCEQAVKLNPPHTPRHRAKPADVA